MSEMKKIRKWFWAWEHEKEELWLNTMAQSGWVLEKIGYATFYFTPCQPGEYTVRLEMREADEGYIPFMEETGAEFIGKVMKWHYFRKKAAFGSFDIFSDVDSKIEHFNKIANMLKAVTIMNLVIGIANSLNTVKVGWVNLLIAVLLAYGLGRIHGRIESLEKERLLME
jgi:hypothetical protein